MNSLVTEAWSANPTPAADPKSSALVAPVRWRPSLANTTTMTIPEMPADHPATDLLVGNAGSHRQGDDQAGRGE